MRASELGFRCKSCGGTTDIHGGRGMAGLTGYNVTTRYDTEGSWSFYELVGAVYGLIYCFSSKKTIILSII
jgi:hypothetical protein